MKDFLAYYCVNETANEAGQILEAVNIVLWYKTHSEQILLTVSSLGKQNLILGYLWLKDHNSEVNWKKEKVEITHCALRYDGCRDL